MLGRKVDCFLPFHSEGVDAHTKQALVDGQLKMELYHDSKKVKELPQLYPGQTISTYSKKTHTWAPGRVINQHSPRSYHIMNDRGNTVRRNRVHIRERKDTASASAMTEAHEESQQQVDQAVKTPHLTCQPYTEPTIKPPPSQDSSW